MTIDRVMTSAFDFSPVSLSLEVCHLTKQTNTFYDIATSNKCRIVVHNVSS